MHKQLENCDSETQATALSPEPRSVKDRLARVRAAAPKGSHPQSAPVSEFADRLEENPKFADA
jgi:hypothetical protein